METYRIEAIPKESTMQEIRRYWEATGRAYTADQGQFVFEDVTNHWTSGESIHIQNSHGEEFIYTVSDFYRFKAIKAPA